MASAISILNHELSSLITRTYRYDEECDLPIQDILNNFKTAMTEHNDLQPIIHINGYNYIYVRSNELIVLTIVNDRFYQRTNIMCYMVFLNKFESILKSYFRTKVVIQDMILDNLPLIYELFDEAFDFGIVQITDFNILTEFIKMEINMNESPELNASISRVSTNEISWRPKGIFYKKNEIFVDMIEKVNVLMDFNNVLKKQIITGQIRVKCYLSGMPILNLGLNEFLLKSKNTFDSFKNISFTNLNFHQSVKLNQFTSNNLINFIPPDGSFVLMDYKIELKKPLLIKVSNINFKKKIINTKMESKGSDTLGDDDINNDVKTVTKLLISIDLITTFPKRLIATDVMITIPINFKKYRINFDNVPRFKTKVGTVLLDLEKKAIVWKISSAGGHRAFQMSSEILLLNDDQIEEEGEMDLEISDSDSENEDNYYDRQEKARKISDNAKKMKQIYKTVQKEKKTIQYETKLNTTLQREAPVSPSLLMELDNQGQVNETNLDTILSSPSLAISSLENQFEINRNVVSINFKIQDLTCSGLQVSYLKIEEPMLEYASFPWVKYVTESDEEYSFKFPFNRLGPLEVVIKAKNASRSSRKLKVEANCPENTKNNDAST